MKMNRVLVKIFFPKIDKQYEVWIPLNKKISTIISLLLKGLNEMNDGIYTPKDMPILYNKITGKNYDVNTFVQNTDIKNGTELILI